MSSAFRLSDSDQGLATLTFDLPGREANIFTREAFEELGERVQELEGRRDIRCLVLVSGKPRIFIAGADIDEIAEVGEAAEAERGSRLGQELFSTWEALPFPTVAAVRGTCVGGGTELALACDHILISDREDVRIGLPEIRLGILPGWGGCVRMPARIGLAAALDLILAGKTLRPRKAFKLGLADALIPDAVFEQEVRAFARRLIDGERHAARKSDLKSLLLEKNPLGRKLVFDQARKQTLAKTRGHYPAPLRAIEVIQVGVSQGEAAGYRAEARAIGELAVSPVCKSLIHVFRLIEAAKKDGLPGVEPRPVRTAAVLGAGAMGGGIAQLIADKADLPVRLKEIGLEPLAKGMGHAAGLFDRQVKRRWISRPEAERKLSLIHPTLEYSGFGRVDLVVEAVVEKLEVKRAVFAELEKRVPEGAVLASNTSSISIGLIAEGARHPERFVGMHFFNPVHKMPLVEIIHGPETADDATRTVVEFARRLGKTAVVVKDGPGFLVNRLLGFTLAESMWLLDEGLAIEDLDRTLTDWGMPMGPATLTDEVGIDVAVEVAQILEGAFGERLALPPWFSRLTEGGRLGVKAGKGFYLYDGKKRGKVDPSVYEQLGLKPRMGRPDPSSVSDRIVLPMLNEAARCLEEGIVRSPGELDLAMIMGTGFPPFRGGLCRWADSQDLARLRDEMERMVTKVGDRFRPSRAFEETAAAGGFYARFS